MLMLYWFTPKFEWYNAILDLSVTRAKYFEDTPVVSRFKIWEQLTDVSVRLPSVICGNGMT